MFFAIALACAVMSLAAVPAAAADTTIDLTPIVNQLVAPAGVLFAAFLSWLAARALKWLKVDLDRQHREALHGAIERFARWAAEEVTKRADLDHIDVRSEIAATIGRKVVEYSPDAAAHFGLGEEALARYIWTRIPDLRADIVDEIVTADRARA